MSCHRLKCWPEPFRAISDGDKRFEIRKEDDRHFEVGDVLLLLEWDPASQKHTGWNIAANVTHIVRGPEWGIPVGMVVMSLEVHPDGY